ncbi:MFS transporter [Streptomyces sp. LaBMicrA B280]|uniref:MFS transporter n=1 Tax=Streptomyces sp. LaBMicrA B280 TaxID=3391001 RepID=UPI003BA46CF1
MNPGGALARGTAKPPGTPVDQPYARRAAVASMVGAVFEWYDFYLYGMATALVFNKVFFSALDSTTGVLAAFATYAVGFVARPLGAVLAGQIADRHGRRRVLILSLVTMGVVTTLVGALPTYRQVGVAAPTALVFLRLLQGVAAGAEQGGAAVFMIEHSGARRRGRWGSLATSGAGLGLLFASGAFFLLQHFVSTADILAGAWRIPFLVSPVLIIVGLIIRTTVPEPEVFERTQEMSATSTNVIGDLFGNHRRQLALGVGLRISQTTASYFYTVFSVYYVGVVLGKASSVGSASVAISSALSLVSAPFWGVVSDRAGRRGWYLFGAIGGALFIAPFFLLVDTRSPVLIGLGVVFGLNVFHDAMSAPQPAWISELFPTAVRGSGVGMSYQIGAVLGGGILPLVGAFLLMAGSGRPWLIVAYFVALSVPTVIAACLAPETGARTFEQLEPVKV